MKQLSNPFVIGKYVNKEYFCDRVKESETLVHHIENGRNVTITGIPEILAICEGGGVSKQRWRDTLIERQRIIDEVIDPFYKMIIRDLHVSTMRCLMISLCCSTFKNFSLS